MSGVRVEKGTGAAPESDAGVAIFATFLGKDKAADLQTFAHSTPPGHPTEHHVHTADVAAYVVRGRMEVGSGPAYADRVLVEPGDYLFIPQGLAHEELVLGDQEVEFVVAHLRDFHTLTAD